MDPIHETIQQVARRVFLDDALVLTDDTTAGDVERWDSLNHVNFIVQVEKAFKIKFKNADIARVENIGELRELVARHRRAA